MPKKMDARCEIASEFNFKEDAEYDPELCEKIFLNLLASFRREVRKEKKIEAWY